MFDFLSKLGAPDEVQGQFGQLVDQFGPPPESVVNDLSTLSQRELGVYLQDYECRPCVENTC